MATFEPHPVGGYVLAGGRSSRMGRDKAFLELAGQPLIGHAVAKLGRICSGVNVLGSNPELAAYAPLVPDLHPGCGPISGMEAALAHSVHDWVLILPVDIPFLPAGILHAWVERITATDSPHRIAIFLVDGRPQPALCLLHKQVALHIAASVQQRDWKLLSAFESAAHILAEQYHVSRDVLFYKSKIAEGLYVYDPASPTASSPGPKDVQPGTPTLWFANLNTPEDLAFAEANSAALDM